MATYTCEALAKRYSLQPVPGPAPAGAAPSSSSMTPLLRLRAGCLQSQQLVLAASTRLSSWLPRNTIQLEMQVRRNRGPAGHFGPDGTGKRMLLPAATPHAAHTCFAGHHDFGPHAGSRGGPRCRAASEPSRPRGSTCGGAAAAGRRGCRYGGGAPRRHHHALTFTQSAASSCKMRVCSGASFNMSSPSQLAEVLYQHLRLPVPTSSSECQRVWPRLRAHC